MHLWSHAHREMLPAFRYSSARQTCLVLTLSVILTIMTGAGGLVRAEDARYKMPVQRTGKAPTPHVGSAMAVLATLEQAHVLPPDNTPEANHVIKSVIQFQSVFAKSEDRPVQDFAERALATKYGTRGADLMAQFRATGWTAALLEALADAEMRAPPEEMQTLAAGFSRFNLSTNDFHRFMLLVREARGVLEKQGLEFQQVYASHRQTMPGASTIR